MIQKICIDGGTNVTYSHLFLFLYEIEHEKRRKNLLKWLKNKPLNLGGMHDKSSML